MNTPDELDDLAMLRECLEYFNERADASMEPGSDHYTANEEGRLAVQIADLIQAASK